MISVVPVSRRGLQAVAELRRQPRLGSNHHRLHTRLQRWVENRQKARVMIGGNLIEPVFGLRFRVDVRVGAADKPEYRWRMPLGAERPKVLTRGRRPGFPDAL